MTSESAVNLGTVALVGRVNVGKSTLFNVLTRQRRMIVSSVPGSTRDRVYGQCYRGEHVFTVIDSGGYEAGGGHHQLLGEEVWQQSERAIAEADLVVLVVDGRQGYHPLDGELMEKMRREQQSHMVVVHKVDDGRQAGAYMSEFYNTLSLNTDPMAVSSTTGVGMKHLVASIEQHLRGLRVSASSPVAVKVCKEEDQEGVRVALVGRPNSGKSSLVNRMIHDNRSCVSAVAGTTRDVIDITCRYHQRSYTLLDTAGLRRRTKVGRGLEKTGNTLSLKALRESDVTIMVIDAKEGFTDQDAKLVRMGVEHGKPMVIAVNKWDLIAHKHTHSVKDYIGHMRERHLANLSYIPISCVSALTNQRVHKLFACVMELVEMSRRRVSTGIVNRALEKIVQVRAPHVIGAFHKRVKFFYITQVSVQPPTFVIKCNVAQALNASYKAFVMKSLKRELGFTKVPIRVIYRGKKDEEHEQRQEKRKAPAVMTAGDRSNRAKIKMSLRV